MQALFDFIAGLLCTLAALAFAQFGVSVHGKSEARSNPPEVRRILPAAQDARMSCGAGATCGAHATGALRKA
jgi:hypothetical protein